MPKKTSATEPTATIPAAEPETSGEITVTVDATPPTDTPPHAGTTAGESVVDPGNGGRCW